MDNFKKWLFYGAFSLTLTGAGLCLAIEAAFVKHAAGAGNEWIWYGTGALIVFNAGISFLGDAIYARLNYNQEKRAKRGK